MPTLATFDVIVAVLWVQAARIILVLSPFSRAIILLFFKMGPKHAPVEIEKKRSLSGTPQAEEEARSRSRTPLTEGEFDKDVLQGHTADEYHHFVDARVCDLFGCHKAYDATERPFSVFCSNDCEVYYQEILQERRPYCANPECRFFF